MLDASLLTYYNRDMAIRKVQFAPGERYHLCARGVGKQALFFEDRDYIRFLFLLLHFQAPIPFFNLSRQVNYFVRSKAFNISQEEQEKIVQQGQVSLESFAIMPNHIHISLQEITKQGVSNYMQRLLTGYAKYFNAKYKRTGHVFEGPFRAVRMKGNEQLLYLSAYIHRNPREISMWKGKELLYPWSSYQDYVRENRWKGLIASNIVMDQFSATSKYQEFVEQSGAEETTFQTESSFAHLFLE